MISYDDAMELAVEQINAACRKMLDDYADALRGDPLIEEKIAHYEAVLDAQRAGYIEMIRREAWEFCCGQRTLH